MQQRLVNVTGRSIYIYIYIIEGLDIHLVRNVCNVDSVWDVKSRLPKICRTTDIKYDIVIILLVLVML